VPFLDFSPLACGAVTFHSKPIPVALMVKLLSRKEEATEIGPASRAFSVENPHPALLNCGWDRIWGA